LQSFSNFHVVIQNAVIVAFVHNLFKLEDISQLSQQNCVMTGLTAMLTTVRTLQKKTTNVNLISKYI